MTWFSDDDNFEAILSRLPDVSKQFDVFSKSYWSLPQVPASTLELCRLRLAQLHQSQSEFEKEMVNLLPAQRESLDQYYSDPSFSEAERACIELTEMYAMDCTAVTDAQAEAVKAHYGDAGLVALVQAIGVFYGKIRISQMWDL